MPFYKTIDAATPEGKRTAEGLLRLKTELDKAIPPKTELPGAREFHNENRRIHQ